MTSEIAMIPVTKRDGSQEPYNHAKTRRAIRWSAQGLDLPEAKLVALENLPVFPGIPTATIQKNIIVESASYISAAEPEWSFFAARALLQTVYKQANNGSITYPHLRDYWARGVAAERLTASIADLYDLEALNNAIRSQRDLNFEYLGMQTLTDRYFIRDQQDVVIELPQHFWMRISMGVAQVETTVAARTAAAIDLYETYSVLKAGSSTPTLFNAATVFPQLSSCFGHEWLDDTDSIMDNMKETSKYSKYAGGDSVSVTQIRGRGQRIKSTGGKAGGPIPYLKIYNDVLLGFDQSGKRKGSGAAYIEPWHVDIEAFLNIRENGDERNRAEDIFPAMWIPDLFMERVRADADWTLFSPHQVPHFHDTFDSAQNGRKFTKAYEAAEAAGLGLKTVKADVLWKQILTRLYQHGVNWPCFKDVSNARYMQNGFGLDKYIVHHSNLCTEILLRDDEETSFVCNLGSINVAHKDHLITFLKSDEDDDLKFKWNTKLEKTVRLWVRNLDAVVGLTSTPHPKGRKFQDSDRAIGLGAMGEAQAIQIMGIPYESAEHVKYSFELWRQISLTAIHESALLARTRGVYPLFSESKWAEGLLPSDTLQHDKIITGFGLKIDLNTPFATEAELRALVKGGMRNSALMAIAPTATIANIFGVLQSHELPWDIEYVKENMSGMFKVIAPTVIHNPFNLPTPTAREVNQKWSIWCAAARQVWIDQSQSLNLFYDPNKDFAELGDEIDENYFEGFDCGVKTNYYMYSRASENEKQTLNKAAATATTTEEEGPACYMRPGDAGFSECESCQ